MQKHVTFPAGLGAEVNCGMGLSPGSGGASCPQVSAADLLATQCMVSCLPIHTAIQSLPPQAKPCHILPIHPMVSCRPIHRFKLDFGLVSE